MTLALNTSHALYGNLKMLLGVNEAGDTLVDLVTPSRTFTKHANAVYGTGGFGRHAGIRMHADGVTTYGWAFDTAFQPANNTGTLVVVFNGVASASYGNMAQVIGSNSSAPADRMLPTVIYGPAGGMRSGVYDGSGGSMQYGPETTTQFITGTPKMVTVTRNSTTGNAIYVNATSEGTGTQMGTDSTAGVYSYLGGITSNAGMSADVVWIAWFDKVLTPTEVSDLYATLGAGNVFGLIAVPASTTTTLSGPSSGTVGVASSNFTVGADGSITGTVVVTPSDGGTGGTFTPTTVSISSGTPTGTFTYTPASTGVKTISTTNNGSLSNPTSLTYTSNAAGDSTAPTLTSPTGTKTGSTTASGTVTTDEGNGTLYFMASTNATESAATVKAGATQAISSTGSKSVSFTGLTASTTYYAHYCHRDAAGNDSTVANSASFTTDAAPSAGTLTTPQPLKNNAVIVQPNLTGLVVHVLLGSSGAVVVSKTGQTTNASGYLVVTDAAITAGTAYFLAFVDPAANAVGMTQKITAV